MLREIKNIGKSYRESKGGNFISSLIKEGRQGDYLLILNFNLANNSINISIKEIDDKVREDYLWIGNNSGNNPQDRLTTNNIEYLLFDSVINLSKGLREDCELKSILNKVLADFFTSIDIRGENVKFLDIGKIEDFNDSVSSIRQKIEEIRNEENKDLTSKKVKEKLKKLFHDLLEENKDLTKKDIELYTITFDNKKPSEFQEYMEYLEKSIIDESFKQELRGVCFVCGEKTKLTYDTAKIPAKFYITKLITFSSGLEGKVKNKGFSKNFSLCGECYKDLISGITYIRNHLNAFLADNTLWIIPGLLFNPITQDLTEDIIELSKRYSLSIFSADNFLEFKEKIERELIDYIHYEDLLDYTYVDLLFYNKPPGREEFKIRKSIREIPLRRIKILRENIAKIKELGDDVLGEDNNWILSLDSIYYLIPVRKGEKQEYKKILDIYENIFLGYRLDKKFLIDSFVTLFWIYRFESPGYNVKPGKNSEVDLVRSILKTNLLLKLFKNLNLLEGGVILMTSLQDILDEEIEKYISKMGYSEEETALFLIGYLIGEIGAKQIEGSDFNAKKPILNKINFNGISPKALINLSNEVFEKLDQYRIRGYNEKIYSVMKSLLDANIKKWELSDSENVYYILSGYAFNTYKRITSSKKKEGEK